MHKYYSISAKNIRDLLSRINYDIEYWEARNMNCKLINIVQENDWYVAFVERVKIA